MRDHQKGSATAYTYDAADRLTASEETIQQTTQGAAIRRTYEYDHRGNLTRELQAGIPVHTYAYNAMDILEKDMEPHTGRRHTGRSRLPLQRARTACREEHVHRSGSPEPAAGTGGPPKPDHRTAGRQHDSRHQGRLPP
ncbi:MAG: hypothetical protein K2L82_17950 [Lachnospiraceae bacterium]|nr:hypothetical protein [Lachnospiraceae bacterium]